MKASILNDFLYGFFVFYGFYRGVINPRAIHIKDYHREETGQGAPI